MQPVTVVMAMRATVLPGARVNLGVAFPPGAKMLTGVTFYTDVPGAAVQGKLWSQFDVSNPDDVNGGSLPVLGTGQADTIMASSRPGAVVACAPLSLGHNAICAELCNGGLVPVNVGYILSVGRI
jgi:hypothetical protein